MSQAPPREQNGGGRGSVVPPQQVIRRHLDEHGGEADATVGHLLSTFDVDEADQSGRERITEALAAADVGLSRPLHFLSRDQELHLFVGTSPGPYRGAHPSVSGGAAEGFTRGVPPTAAAFGTQEPPATKRLKRPVTLGGLLISLLLAAVLFAGLATGAVLTIDDPGPPGERGAVGAQGDRGQPGKRGKSGLNGVNGAPGAPGAAGARGSRGSAGARGSAGEDGAREEACSNDVEVPLPYC
jgi:hypothetical protein